MVSFRVANFLSINEPVEVMFIPSEDQSHPEQLTEDGYLRTAALFGANGSGKTNIVLAFDYLKYLVTGEHSELISKKHKARLKGDVSCFASSDSISRFELFHKTDKFNYRYCLHFNSLKDEVVFEELSVLSDDEVMHFFTRNNQDIIISGSAENDEEFIRALEAFDDPKKTVLSLKSKFNIPFIYLLSTYREIEAINILTSTDYDSFEIHVDNAMESLKILLSCLNEISDVTGYGLIHIPELTKKDSPSNYDLKPWIMYNRNVMFVFKFIKDESIEVYEVRFCLGESKDYLPLNQLSTGVLRIIDVIMRILSTFPNEYAQILINELIQNPEEDSVNLSRALVVKPSSMIFVYDEICYALHPSIVNRLLKNILEIDQKAQFIITLHESELMSREVLRADEMWLVNKKMNITTIESLDSYELPSDDLKTDYLSRRFDGVPRFRRLMN